MAPNSLGGQPYVARPACVGVRAVHAHGNTVICHQEQIREPASKYWVKLLDPNCEVEDLAAELKETLAQTKYTPAKLMAFIEAQTESLRQESVIGSHAKKRALVRYHYGMAAWGMLADRVSPTSPVGRPTDQLRHGLRAALDEHDRRWRSFRLKMLAPVFLMILVFLAMGITAMVVLAVTSVDPRPSESRSSPKASGQSRAEAMVESHREATGSRATGQ
ncbi:MAG TPA: hypothetical protein ENJ16_05495 [Planctomycetaceae bacterium]|nr:hypothetical protein [Planctomycetaceae bacterium]